MSFVVPNRILFANVCELLSQGKTVVIEVKGCSMLPFIVGDRDSVKLAQTWWGGEAMVYPQSYQMSNMSVTSFKRLKERVGYLRAMGIGKERKYVHSPM